MATAYEKLVAAEWALKSEANAVLWLECLGVPETEAVPAAHQFWTERHPPSPVGVVPGTGKILAQDLDPTVPVEQLWKWCNAPGNVTGITTGGDTHPTIDGSLHEGYRRLYPPIETGTGARRLMMGTSYYGTPGSSFYVNQEGETNIYYWSVRIDNRPTVNSMVWEMYNAGEGSPVFHFDHYGGELALVLNHPGDKELNKIWHGPVTPNTWYRFAMAVHHSTDPAKGWVQLWTFDPLLTPLTGKVTGYATINPTGSHQNPGASALEAGIYQGLSEPLIELDFANWQVAEFNA